MTSSTATDLSEPEERSLDDYSMRFLAIVSVATVTEGGDRLAEIEPVLARHGGQIVEGSGAELLAVFPRLERANGFAREVQRAMLRAGEHSLRLGINLGALRKRDIAYARKLRDMARPGQICISSVSTNKLTSRVRADGLNEPPGWRLYVLPTIGLTGFLGYFFGWFYAIYWKIAYYVSNDQFPCWPEFMCG